MEYENSGTERKEGNIFCPKCGTRLQAGDVFCDNCGYELGGQRKKKLAGMKELRLPLAIGGAAVVIMAAGVFFAVKGLGFLGGGFGGAAEELLFISDESVYGVDLKKPDKKPVEYTDSFYDTEEDTIGNVFRLSFPTVSGKYRFIVEDYNAQDKTYTLCYQTGKKELEKIASDVQGYCVTKDSKVVYVKNDNLYVCEPGDKAEKVDSDIAWSSRIVGTRTLDSDMDGVYISQDGKTLLWSVDTGEESGADFYCQDIELKGKKVKLASDSSLVDYTANFESLLFWKGDDLYLSKGLEKAEKVAGDVNGVMGIDLEKGTFFYTTKKEKKKELVDYITDDMAEEDAQIKEPVKSDYEKETSGYSLWRYTTVDDQYYDDLEKFRDKEKRDELRKVIQDMDPISIPYTELYFYADGQETLVTSDYSVSVASSDPSWDSWTDLSEKSRDFTSAVLYLKEKPVKESGEKTKLSELPYFSNPETMKMAIENRDVAIAGLYGAEEPETSYFLYSDGVDKELDLDGQTVRRGMYDARNNQLVLLVADEDKGADSSDQEEEPGELMTVSLSGETAELVPYDEDVSSLELVYGGNIYYLKDVGKNGEGDLYRSQESMMYDVRENGLWAVPDSKAVIALTDYDKKSQTGTLNLLCADSEEGEEIAADIYLDAITFTAFGEDCIVMLSDYNFERGSGDLLYYNGKETKTLESDVTAYFAEYPGSDAAAYFSGENIDAISNALVRDFYSDFGGRGAGAEETTAAASEAEERWASPETEAAAEAGSEDDSWWY